VIRELKQNSGKDQPKENKKGETSSKDKALAIMMASPKNKESDGSSYCPLNRIQWRNHMAIRAIIITGPKRHPPATYQAIEERIKNGDQPFPVIAQVSLAETAQNVPPTLKDPKFWTAEEKKTRKIDRLARSLMFLWRERFMNYLEEQTDGEAMINSIQNGDQPFPVIAQVNETAKDLWDALERQMRESENAEPDRKAAILYEYPLALVAEKMKVSKRKKKVKVQSESEETSSFANKKPHYVKSVEKKEDKKADEKKRDMSKVKCYNCKKEGHFAKDCKKAKVLSDSDESSSSAEETIAAVAYYTYEFGPCEENCRIDTFDPSTFDLGIFLGFDFDHWARKVLKLGFLIL
nr:hypothetical protein [Tanacetum cinerariifolium]